jgi:hypothetical protein
MQIAPIFIVLSVGSMNGFNIATVVIIGYTVAINFPNLLKQDPISQNSLQIFL